MVEQSYIVETSKHPILSSPVFQLDFFDASSVFIHYPLTTQDDEHRDYIKISRFPQGDDDFIYLYPGDSIYIEDIWTLGTTGKLVPAIYLSIPYSPILGSSAQVFITKFKRRGGTVPLLFG